MTFGIGFILSKLLGVSLLGVGGWLAKLLGWHTQAIEIAKKIPRWMWITLGVILLCITLYILHNHWVHQFKTEVQRAQMAADNDYWKAKLNSASKDAHDWKNNYEANQTQIAQK